MTVSFLNVYISLLYMRNNNVGGKTLTDQYQPSFNQGFYFQQKSGISDNYVQNLH